MTAISGTKAPTSEPTSGEQAAFSLDEMEGWRGGVTWRRAESLCRSERWEEQERYNNTGWRQHLLQHQAEWNMSPCHLPHTGNGWPPQSCHQRLMSAARKVVKRDEQHSNARKSLFCRKTCCNLLHFPKTNMTGWNYSATAEAVIYKCCKVQV